MKLADYILVIVGLVALGLGGCAAVEEAPTPITSPFPVSSTATPTRILRTTQSTDTSPPITAPATLAPTSTSSVQEHDEVALILDKDVYEVGEPITLTIVNHTGENVYYRFSATVVQWIGDEAVDLVRPHQALDVWPRITAIEPGTSIIDIWDQEILRYWKADPDLQGHSYHFRFYYARTIEEGEQEEELGEIHTVTSPVFRIE